MNLNPMANIILFDNEVRDQLLPFTFLRPVCELRIGILTIREKWERWMDGFVAFITQDYLAQKYPIDFGEENYLINGSVLPSPQLCTLLRQMEFNEAFLRGDELIAAKLDGRQFERLINDEDFGELKGFDLENTEYLKINHPWDLFLYNGEAIESDFELLTQGRRSQPLSPSNRLIGEPERLFIEPGASVEGATINTTTGPVYIGAGAVVMEGCLIRGGLALGEQATLKMGAKIYGPTTIGPHCRVAGEVKNAVFLGRSNKAHDGYLGNSVIGEWCNLGANTNCSNLKNTWSEVTVWSYADIDFSPSGQRFCGLFMGDHSMSGINSMFNTGTVVGVGCNIFGSGFPARFIPSFSWGGSDGLTTYRTDRAFDAIERMMTAHGRQLEVEERLILLRVFEETHKFRIWEED